MLHAISLVLEDDTVDHIDWIAKELAKQREVEKVTRGDAVKWLVLRHWKKMQKQRFNKASGKQSEHALVS